MTYTVKQNEILRWIDGKLAEPPVYENGGLAAAIARLRKKGYVAREGGLTPLGRTVLDCCCPGPRRRPMPR
jgi:hypothetical protein